MTAVETDSVSPAVPSVQDEPASFVPGAATVGEGLVRHRRTRPATNSFEMSVPMIWIDPDRPHDLFDRHPLWSCRRPAPVRFRREDYGGTADRGPLGDGVRRDLAAVLRRRPDGPVRMLTQPRTFGWLFNPITFYFAWERPTDDPVGVVAEVTNTPWKERHRYSVALAPGRPLRASFDKQLHVSPFLDTSCRYEMRVEAGERRIDVGLDVHHVDSAGRTNDGPVLRTSLVLDRTDGVRSDLTSAIIRRPLATHRVSARIHMEAVRLWLARVPFIAHPRHATSER